MDTLLAQIAPSGVPYTVDRLYTYRVPAELREKLRAGMRVMIPFGRGNRHVEGFVFEVGPGEDKALFKPILSVLDEQPLMEEELLRLAKWMKARYFCTLYDAVKAILPAGIWYHYRKLYTLREGQEGEAAAALCGEEEAALLAEISAKGEAELASLRKVGGKETDKLLRALCEKGVLTMRTEMQRQVSDRSVRVVQLAMDAEDALAEVEKKRASAPARYAAVEMLCREGALLSSELSYYTGVSLQTLRGLEKAGIVRLTEEELLRVPDYSAVPKGEPIVLNDEQEAAFAGLCEMLRAGETSGALLHGVTASGKTQVYLRLIMETLKSGRNAMLLVPEIALTPQMMAKVTSYFGSEVAMLHSGLRLSERYDQWKRIRRGEVRVILGTRSAVFAPLENLGLIIIDEEQESSYQSENPPRYHTRDIAQFRCAQNSALLLLGSATPSVETMFFARQARYRIFNLRRRYNNRPLPRVSIVDLREELRQGNDSLISAPLREELAANLSRGEQSILFLNRRGNSRMLLCGECGEVPECPRCSVPMTYHSANRRMMCHYCGHSEPVIEYCRSCGGRMKAVGSGTQKIEEELTTLFPGTKILRMDADTVSAGNGHEKLLQKFEKENIPILLGTQMVAKGLDFENVTLVGVLSADLSLYVDNYHAAERTFNLLAQVVGRAGRGSRQGRAVIQTYTPENDVIRAAAAQDYEAFFDSEIRMRKLRRYPPFADLFAFSISGAEETRVIRSAAALRDALAYAAQKDDALRALGLEVLGPAAAPVVKVNGRYRYRVYLIGRNCAPLRRMVAEYLYAFYQHKENRDLDIFVDCNALQ